MLAFVASNGGHPYSLSFWVCELFRDKKGVFSCGFINNKYGLIFTKLFRGRKGWQLRRRLHGNCKEVINKAWSGDIWKCDSQGNENNLTKYYPSPYLTQGQLKKRCQSWRTARWALKLQSLAFPFVWQESGSSVQVGEMYSHWHKPCV